MPHPPVIDGSEFARCNSRLAGSRRGDSLPRLRECLYAPDGTVDFEIEGVPEMQGRPALRLQVSAKLALQCQRCLGRVDVELSSKAVLLLYDDEAELAAHRVEVEGPEHVLAGREMQVLDLVEDEVLLAIPQAPRHGQCRTHDGDARGAPQRPFAGLRALMGGKR